MRLSSLLLLMALLAMSHIPSINHLQYDDKTHIDRIVLRSDPSFGIRPHAEAGLFQKIVLELE